jgi:predicted secreted protein
MRWFSIVAIYFLFWFMALFAVLPFSANPPEEVGAKAEPGHAESAPHVFRPWPIVVRTTIAAAILFAIFYFCYREGWLDIRLAAGTTLQSGRIQ